MNYWSYIVRWVWGLFVVVVLVGLALIFMPQYSKYQENKVRLAEIEELKRIEEAKLRELRVRQERFQTESRYVEQVAHELGMVKPEETIFKFYDEIEPAEARPAPPAP